MIKVLATKAMHIVIRRLAIMIRFQTDDESVAWGNYNINFSIFRIFDNQPDLYLCKNLSLQITEYTQYTVYGTEEKRLLLPGINYQFPQC